MAGPRPIAYYITAHGYGHGVRSCDIIRAYHRHDPGRPFILVTDLPESFLRNRLPDVAFTVRPQVLDAGMYQLDSVRVDVDRTLHHAWDLHRRRASLLDEERQFLVRDRVGLVVADIPSLPFEAARREGLPSVAVGNFSWSWIYSAFADRDPKWKEIIAAYAEGYAQADVLLRLPFAEEMEVFPRRVDVPVVAEPGRSRRSELATWTGADTRKRWVLLSFSTLDWDDAALDRVQKLDDEYTFFTVRPLEWARRNIIAVDREQIPFSDVLASVDAVITKPGFGVLSECVVNDKPIVYVDRTDFLEYPVLEQAIKRYLRHAHIPAASLYAGDVRASLDEVFDAPLPPEHAKLGGGDIVAAHLRGAFGLAGRIPNQYRARFSAAGNSAN